VTGWEVLRFGCTHGSRYSGLYDLLSSIPPCVGLGFGIVVREYSSILRLDFDAFCKLFSGYGSMQAGKHGACTLCLLFLPQSWMVGPHTCIPMPETGISIRTMDLLCGMRASGLGQNLVSFIELPMDYNTLVVREVAMVPRERHLVSTFRIRTLVIPPSSRLPTCPTPEPPSSRRCSP
jgi:hypothetical protein